MKNLLIMDHIKYFTYYTCHNNNTTKFQIKVFCSSETEEMDVLQQHNKQGLKFRSFSSCVKQVDERCQYHQCLMSLQDLCIY